MQKDYYRREYQMPNLSSSGDPNPLIGNPPGELSFATTPDAVSSPGLGWVVAYAVNISGYNAINVKTEFGCAVTISSDPLNPVHLINVGVTTSGLGDWYVTFQTFHQLVDQWAVYRAPGEGCQQSPTYLTGQIQANIDPSKWFYYDSNLGRCITATGPPPTPVCYTSGDYFRPAMNVYTGATVPMVVPSANLNDLSQAFIYDPPAPNVTHFTFEQRKNGDNITKRGILTREIVKHIALGQHLFRVSSMTWECLR